MFRNITVLMFSVYAGNFILKILSQDPNINIWLSRLVGAVVAGIVAVLLHLFWESKKVKSPKK